MKRFILLIIVSVLSFCVLFAGCIWPNDTVPRDRIFSYVNENYGLLEEFPYNEIEEIDRSTDYEENKKQEERIIKKHLGNYTIVRSVYAYNENILRFFCGGSGFVGGSTSTGFYFSKNDTPYALDFDGCELSEIQEGIFEWEGEGGSHKIHTEKIRDNWYYYILEWY